MVLATSDEENCVVPMTAQPDDGVNINNNNNVGSQLLKAALLKPLHELQNQMSDNLLKGNDKCTEQCHLKSETQNDLVMVESPNAPSHVPVSVPSCPMKENSTECNAPKSSVNENVEKRFYQNKPEEADVTNVQKFQSHDQSTVVHEDMEVVTNNSRDQDVDDVILVSFQPPTTVTNSDTYTPLQSRNAHAFNLNPVYSTENQLHKQSSPLSSAFDGHVCSNGIRSGSESGSSLNSSDVNSPSSLNNESPQSYNNASPFNGSDVMPSAPPMMSYPVDVSSTSRPPKPKRRIKPQDRICTADGHILCRVCGDKASGFHYGVFSCEGCKGFFRRTVRQKLVYKPCDNTKGCLIMRISRNRCQYCRMQRCISAGMSHEAVRLGRCPKKDKPKRLDFFKLPKNQQGTVDVDKQIKSEQMVLNIHNSFRMALNGDACDLLSHMAITKDMNRDEISALCSKYLAEVVKFVTFFARELPQFTELGMEDQRMLIKSSLLEICVIHYVIYSSENDLLNLNILKLEDNSEKSDLICDLMKVLCSCTKKLLKLNLTEVEYAILAALLLFCPDRENIQHAKVMEGLEDELSQALRCQLLLNHKEKALMFPKLVEVIVDIRAISTTFLEDIMMAQVEVSD